VQRELGMVTGVTVGFVMGWIAHRLDERVRETETEIRLINNTSSNGRDMEELKDILRQGLLGQHPDFHYEGKKNMGPKASFCTSCQEQRYGDEGYIADHGRCFRCDELAAEVNAE
jgi:hypothetical protein